MKTIAKNYTIDEAMALAVIAESTESKLKGQCGKYRKGSRGFDVRADLCGRLHTALADGSVEALVSALRDCADTVGIGLNKWWGDTFTAEDLCGYASVIELINK